MSRTDGHGRGRRGDEAARGVVRRAVADLVARLPEAERLALVDAPDAVHQARVLVRRLRSVLSVYRPLLDRAVVPAARHDLRAAGAALGKVRDLEVGALRAEELLADVPRGPARAELTRLLVERERDRHRAAHAGLVGWLGARPLAGGAVAAFAATVSGGDGSAGAGLSVDAAAVALLGRRLERAAGRVLAAADAVGTLPAVVPDDPRPRSIDPVTEAGLHEVRKAARRLRYAAEAIAEDVPGAGGLEAAGETLQGLLGDHRDDLVLAGRVAAPATGPDPAVAVLAGELAERLRARSAAVMAGYEPALADLRSALVRSSRPGR